MSNLAALIPAAKSPLVVQEVGFYTPGPKELLIKNEVIAFNPIEHKIARLAIFPLQYPAILGSAYGGTVEAIGSEVTNFKIGDKVTASRKFAVIGNQYGAFQRYVVATELVTSKVAPNVDVEDQARVIGNLSTVVGLFTCRAGLDRPSVHGTADAKNKKVLIYGGSSTIGSLGVQYVSRAGYAVFTTSSPRNNAFVSKLGAVKVFDHTQSKEELVKAIVAEGPFDLVVDVISTPEAIAITGPIVAAQGGGELFATLPPFGPETTPEGVTRVYESWSSPPFTEKIEGLLDWAFKTYLPQSVASGRVIPLPAEKIAGGLASVDSALDRLGKGVSGVKLILNPWA